MGGELSIESRRVHSFVSVVALVAVVGTVVAARNWPVHRWLPVLALSALCVIGDQWRVRRLPNDTDLSFNAIVQLAALVLAGPVAALVVAASPALFAVRNRRLITQVFNVAMMAVVTLVAGTSYYVFGGAWGQGQGSSSTFILLHVAVPLMLANSAQCLANAALLAGVISLDQKVPYREVIVGILRSGGVAYVGYGIFGLLLAVLWDGAEIGALSAVLVLAPLFVARWAFAQYAEEHAAHDRTVAALVRAVEAKDFYTRGHSERVAKASVLIARVVGLSQQRTSTLHFAGMLHDVGKLGVPTRVLQKTGALSDEEFAAIARHPVRGLEMVREIEFLGEAFKGILHHHERLDGRGYPMGLSGTSIPEFARIIAVADAFDSMTSTRSYRQARDVEQALVELDRCVGTQFDPTYVDALHTALERTAWQPTMTVDPVAAVVEGVDELDHDDPRAPIRRQVATPHRGVG